MKNMKNMKDIKMLKLLKMSTQLKNGYTDCFELKAAVCSTDVAWNGQRRNHQRS